MKLSASEAVLANLQTGTTFEQIVQDHQAMVFRTLARLSGSREHIEDLAQEVFFRLYRALPTFRGEAMLTTYLYRITVNVAQDEWKRRRRVERPLVSIATPYEGDETGLEERLPDQSPDAEQQFAQRQFQQAVEDQLQQLSVIERTVLVLYHQEERSYEQIAFDLKLPINTVRTHLHRGRKKLREGMQRQNAQTSGRKAQTEQKKSSAERSAACQVTPFIS